MVKDDVQEVGVIKKKEGKVLKCQYNKNKSAFNQQTWLLFFLFDCLKGTRARTFMFPLNRTPQR